MSITEGKFLEACERGKLKVVQELIKSKAVDPATIVEKCRGHQGRIGIYSYPTDGWRPLHYACA